MLIGKTKIYVQREKDGSIKSVYVRIPASVWTDSQMFLQEDDICQVSLDGEAQSIVITKSED